MKIEETTWGILGDNLFQICFLREIGMDFWKIVLSICCVDLIVEWKKKKETNVKLIVSIDVFISVQFSSLEWSTFWKLKPRMIKFRAQKF